MTYQTIQINLYEDLLTEFGNDLTKWDATLNQNTLSIVFNAPEILFDKSTALLKDNFKEILNDFFPRYINLIESKYKDELEEIRIEGYTDSDGIKGNTEHQNYFYNMQLSQDRTRHVLEYCMTLTGSSDKFKWLSNKITANGLSFSHLKFYQDGVEDKERSRRVEFRVKTKADTKIRKIIETMQQ